jgi:hypothetical protein
MNEYLNYIKEELLNYIKEEPEVYVHLLFAHVSNFKFCKNDNNIVDAADLLCKGTGHQHSRNGDDARKGVELMSASLLQPMYCAKALGTNTRVVTTMRGRAWS